MRSPGRLLAWLGWSVLAVVAAVGVLLSLVALLAAAPFARPFVAGRVVRILDDAIAGTLALDGIEVLARGGIELRGAEVYDPHGHLVLSAARARVFVDLTGLRARAIGLSVELESPSVLLEEEPDGGVSLVRAFASSRPAEDRPGGARPEGEGGGFTIHVSRLEIRNGDVWWVDERGETRLEASGLEVEGRGLYGPGRARFDVRARGTLAEPAQGPLELELAGGIDDGFLRVPVLSAALAETRLSAVGEARLAERTGRIAVRSLGLSRDLARALAPETPEGDDLAGVGYLEADGEVLTAALRAELGEGRGGRADAAVATRLAAPVEALGFDVLLERFDPARLVAAAPRGELNLAARGALAGGSMEDLRGELRASVQRSRLRGGEIARAEIVARAARGTIEVSRATLAAPGLAADATGRWREGAAVAGRASVDAKDLRAALRNLSALSGAELPALSGAARIAATLGGTSAAPVAEVSVEAPALRLGDLAVTGARLKARLSGPARAPTGTAEGTLATFRRGRDELVRGATLRGTFADEALSLAVKGAVPGFRDPATLEVGGRLGPRRETLGVSTLALAYPGARWELVAPATVTLAGPRVDRLALEGGGQRIAVEGGLGRRGALDARAELTRLDLARLPAGLLPAEEGIRGEVSADVRAAGTTARPDVAATFSIAGGAYRNLAGLAATGSAAWRGGSRRAEASVTLSRAEGGTVDVRADLPLPLAGRRGERLLAHVRAAEVPLGELLALARSDLPVAGIVALEASLDGTVGAPVARVAGTLAAAAWQDLGGLHLELSADAPGKRVRVRARLAQAGAGVAQAEAEVPLDLADLLAAPEQTARALRRAPLAASVRVTGLELAAISGHAGVPAGIAGAVDGAAEVTGTVAAPRARVAVELARGVAAGYEALGAHLEVTLGDAAVSGSGRLSVAGDEALRLEASLGAALERLLAKGALGTAPLRVEALVPGLALARAAREDLPLTGRVAGRLVAGGTLRAPEVTLEVEGAGIAISGRPLGEGRAEARYADRRGRAEVHLRPQGGGTLRAALSLDADLGLGAAGPPLAESPAELAASAESVDLGFLAAALPTVVRSAGGRIALDLRARGPLARMVPRGSLRVDDGRIAVTEYGELTGIFVVASMDDDEVELSRLEARRGRGRVTASGSLRGLRTARARLEGRVAAEAFTIVRAGMTVATVEARADLSGGYSERVLAVEVNVPKGVITLPRRSPRALQTLERRGDIVVGEREPRRERPADEERAAPERPFTLAAHLVVPRNLFVKSDDPRIDLELKADVRYERSGGEEYAEGTIEVVRGSVEPIGGRTFLVERGRVQFTGGPPSAAMLDVQARYDNPIAVVTVVVQGPTSSPEIQLSSQPPMDDGQIAVFIATGRTELKPGGGGVGTLTGEEAGRAALGALATQAFRDLVADKLPLDTVALDSGALRAGKYVTDKIYVGYVRRFEADPQRGENLDEVRVEYQISPRWTFESRYGNAQSGGASLIWSRDY